MYGEISGATIRQKNVIDVRTKTLINLFSTELLCIFTIQRGGEELKLSAFSAAHRSLTNRHLYIFH